MDLHAIGTLTCSAVNTPHNPIYTCDSQMCAAAVDLRSGKQRVCTALHPSHTEHKNTLPSMLGYMYRLATLPASSRQACGKHYSGNKAPQAPHQPEFHIMSGVISLLLCYSVSSRSPHGHTINLVDSTAEPLSQLHALLNPRASDRHC